MPKISKYTVEIRSPGRRWLTKRKAEAGAQMLADSWNIPVGLFKLIKVYRPRGKRQ